MHHDTLIMLALLCFTGCEADDPCDKGQSYHQGACTPQPPAADEDAASAYTHDAGSCSEDQALALGRPCTDDSSCNCAAPYCAKQPGQAMGTCTVFCHTMPDDCPTGYSCFDLAALGVTGIEPFCTPK